jgi:hypothetical protein
MNSKTFNSLTTKERLKPKFFVDSATIEELIPSTSVKQAGFIQRNFPTSLTYSSKTLGQASAKELVENNPDKLFVYNFALLNQKGANKGDHALHGAGPNTFGLPSLRRYSVDDSGKDKYTEEPTILRDGADGQIIPEVKREIDTAINALKDKQAKGAILVFPTGGFGQGMKEKNKAGSEFAPQTFLYLSQQLYENFGYLNPQYLNTDTGVSRVQLGQEVTDEEIKQLNNQSVLDFIKLCKS